MSSNLAKPQDGAQKNGNQPNQQTSSQSNPLGLASQIQQQKDQNNKGDRVQANPQNHEQGSSANSARKNSNANQNNDSSNNHVKKGVQGKEVNVNYSDDEFRINPDLEKFFKKREFMEQISKPMFRSSQDRFGDIKSGGNQGGTQQQVNNQRRALQQIGMINKQESNNESNKLSKLKRYSDKLSYAIKNLQAWEEPLNQMGVGKTLDEKFEIAEKMLNRWQDLGLVDGPDTEQMMMKYPEYEDQLQSENNQFNRQSPPPSNQTPPKFHSSHHNFNRINREDQDEEDVVPVNNFKIRSTRDGSQSTRNKNGTSEQFRPMPQSPKLNTERSSRDEQQQQRQPQQFMVNNNMLTPQNKFRKASQQNPKRNANMIDDQIIRNLNETKFLEDQKNLIMGNTLNKPQYQQRLMSNTQPINQYGQNSNDYRKSPSPSPQVDNFNGNGQNRPRLRTPKRSEKVSAPVEYNEAITNEIEKQYRMRYSSAEPHQNNLLFEGQSKYGSAFNPNSIAPKIKHNYATSHRTDENDASSIFPQIHNFSDTFRLTSGGKLKNPMNLSTRAETPKRRTNYGSNAYPHGTLLTNQPRGSTPKYSRNQQ